MTAPDDFDQLFDASSAAPAQPLPAPARPPAGVEARKEVRVRVKWAARVLLADDRVVPLTVRDVSETGVGLVAESPIASHAVMRIAVAVPHLEVPSRFTTVTGSFRTAHCTVSGPDLLYGGIWVELEPAGRDLIRKWIRRLRP
ncbi:MAG: hypothetical protein ACTHL8_14375 [Burkholderiaceae bacterium]